MTQNRILALSKKEVKRCVIIRMSEKKMSNEKRSPKDWDRQGR